MKIRSVSDRGDQIFCRRRSIPKGWIVRAQSIACGTALLLAAALDAGDAGAAEPPGVAYAGVNLAGGEFGACSEHGVHGFDYTYPTRHELEHFHRLGMNIVRIPVRLDRLQHGHCSELDEYDMRLLDNVVSHAIGTLGLTVILDLRADLRDLGTGGDGAAAATLADFWSRIAAYADNEPKLWFGLINEPHRVHSRDCFEVQQATIERLRRDGWTNTILVQGSRWSGAHSWLRGDACCGCSNATAADCIDDPLDRTLIEVHQYLDHDSSGKSPECVSATVGVERVAEFTRWLERSGRRGFLGEFAGGPGPTCLAALDGMLRHLHDHSEVWTGWTYWAAGPWWGNYPFSIEPRPGGEAAQLAVLRKYLPARAAP